MSRRARLRASGFCGAPVDPCRWAGEGCFPRRAPQSASPAAYWTELGLGVGGGGDTTQSTNVRVCGVAAAGGVTLDGPLISEHVCKMGVTVFEFVGIM